MNRVSFYLLRFSLILLITALCVGVAAAFVFFDTGFFNQFLPFYKLRPIHVTASIFWILTAAQGGVIYYLNDYYKLEHKQTLLIKASYFLWLLSIILILISFLSGKFGGREYWEFPPILAIPILLSWALFAIHFFKIILKNKGKKPVYIWMWSTGVVFFLLTYIEANLWQIPWFRENVIRDITVQWKANGAIVGSWNQLVYGTAFYLMAKIGEDENSAFDKKSFFFYFLGLTNLIFNWGHHTYNVPAATWVRDVSYVISMTEWILLINIMQNFKSKISEAKKFLNIIPYRFLLASEAWVFLNLILAILMSIPAINIYTHGTHITVAHAMGATIGINTMILFASLFFIFSKRDSNFSLINNKTITIFFWSANIALLFFWAALILAGITKGYYMVSLSQTFETAMQHVKPYLFIFSITGTILAFSLLVLSIVLLRAKIFSNNKA